MGCLAVCADLRLTRCTRCTPFVFVLVSCFVYSILVMYDLSADLLVVQCVLAAPLHQEPILRVHISFLFFSVEVETPHGTVQYSRFSPRE